MTTDTALVRLALNRLLADQQRARDIYLWTIKTIDEDVQEQRREGFTYHAEKGTKKLASYAARLARTEENIAALETALTMFPEE